MHWHIVLGELLSTMEKCGKYDLSVIVPVYNVEKYIKKCIDSILNQGGCRIQIVMVNDGSEDNSREIARKYVTEDDQVLLIDQKNGGLGNARNTGLKYAEGDYILFVDSDDYLEKNTLSLLLDKVRKYKLDVLQAGYIKIDEDGTIVKVNTREPFEKPCVGKDWLAAGNVMYGACFCIYSTSFLKSNNLKFLEGLYHEDMDFTLHAVYLAKRLMVVDVPFYYYLSRELSITGEKSFRRCLDYYKVSKYVAEWVTKEVDRETYGAFFRDYLAFLFSHSINLCIISGIPIKKMLEDGERRKLIVKYLDASTNRTYKTESILIRMHLYKVYEIMYRMCKGDN